MCAAARARAGEPAPAHGVELPSLMSIAMCCRRSERMRFSYRDGADRVSERRVEPHRLVSLGRRWYLVGFDLDRDDWRTYRVDRVSALDVHGSSQHTASDARCRRPGIGRCRRARVRHQGAGAR